METLLEQVEKINELMLGQKITKIEGCQIDSDWLTMYFDNGHKFSMTSTEDGANDVGVWLEDINGDFENHIGATFQKLVVKEGVSKQGTYTFYTIVTSKGYIDLRWNGQSNGYYSEHCGLFVY